VEIPGADINAIGSVDVTGHFGTGTEVSNGYFGRSVLASCGICMRHRWTCLSGCYGYVSIFIQSPSWRQHYKRRSWQSINRPLRTSSIQQSNFQQIIFAYLFRQVRSYSGTRVRPRAVVDARAWYFGRYKSSRV